MAAPGITAPAGPAAEHIPPPGWLTPCDATASGAEAGQVQLARGREELTLCSHHYSQFEFSLIAAGWHMTRDDRARLAALILSWPAFS